MYDGHPMQCIPLGPALLLILYLFCRIFVVFFFIIIIIYLQAALPSLSGTHGAHCAILQWRFLGRSGGLVRCRRLHRIQWYRDTWLNGFFSFHSKGIYILTHNFFCWYFLYFLFYFSWFRELDMDVCGMMRVWQSCSLPTHVVGVGTTHHFSLR